MHFYQSCRRAILHHSVARLVKHWPALKLDNDFVKIHIGVPVISEPVPVSVVEVVPAFKNWLDPATAVGGILPQLAKGKALPLPELYDEVTSTALNTLPYTPTSSKVMI